MTRHVSPFVALAALLSLFAAGCETQKIPPPTSTASATLDPSVRKTSLTTRLGTDLKLELPPPKRPGHVWTIMQNDTRYLRPLTEISPPAPDTGLSTVHFHAMTTGRTALRFIAIPLGASKEATPGDNYDVVVTIQSPPEK